MYDITAYQPININVLAGVLGFSGHQSAKTIKGLSGLLKKRGEYLTKTKDVKKAVEYLNASYSIVTGAFKVVENGETYVLIYAQDTNAQIVKNLREEYKYNHNL